MDFFILFAAHAQKVTPKSRLKSMRFVGIAIGYGSGEIICAIYNCDANYHPKFINSSVSQIIHDLMGMITYLIVTFSMVMIAAAYTKWKNNVQLTEVIYLISAISYAFVIIVLNLNLDSACNGLI